MTLSTGSTHVVPALQIEDATRKSREHQVRTEDPPPKPLLSATLPGEVSLADGLFRDRRELDKRYVLELNSQRVLQNHLLEAGVRIDAAASEMHGGWESPHCQVRGHFMGHWLSAVARFAAVDRDPLARARVSEALGTLKRCQDLNRGRWIGSIPEKYFEILADDRATIWSPQYTLHKTMMGLLDAYRFTGEPLALEILERSAAWFTEWTQSLADRGIPERGYSGECSGMLELWADLYGLTQKTLYLDLASRYASPDLFDRLTQGEDVLTRNHANATIPWIHGAMRLYEVTGDGHFLNIAQKFWQEAVESRGMFATTGNNAGEFFIPKGQYSQYLGTRTQEHCTVYNMIRVAHDLLRFTGDARYADHIERALYNGILTQQNPHTGMVCYFLPLSPGARKTWGSKTSDFWCCHGTLVQAHAMFEDWIYYRAADGITVSQFISSSYRYEDRAKSVQLTQRANVSGYQSDGVSPSLHSTLDVQLEVTASQRSRFTLRIRHPAWTCGPVKFTVNGDEVPFVLSQRGYWEHTREWEKDVVSVAFPKTVNRESLPGSPNRFALLDGPIVLAALTQEEPILEETSFTESTLTPQYEHQYVEGRDWQTSHYLLRTVRGTVKLVPLYEVVDEAYTVYFASLSSTVNC